MTDALAHIDWAARDLIDRVEAALVRYGAPDEHSIWSELRDVGAMPADVYEFLASWPPAHTSPTTTALELIRERLQYQHTTLTDAAVASGAGWQGPSAEAFHRRWHAYASGIAGGSGSLDQRVEATAGYVNALAEWARHWRTELAGTLLACLTSAEAVALHDPDNSASAAAAATIGVRILRVGSGAIRAGEAIVADWGVELSRA